MKERTRFEHEMRALDLGPISHADFETPGKIVPGGSAKSPFPAAFAPPWTNSVKLQRAFDDAIAAVSDPRLYPAFGHLPNVRDVAITIAAIAEKVVDGKVTELFRPRVGQHEFEMYYSGSLLKAAAMYAAYQLRVAVNDFVSDPAIAVLPDKDLFTAIERALNPQIRKAVRRINDRKPPLDEKFLVPKYKEIFKIIRDAGKRASLDFDIQFMNHLRPMIVGSHNDSASFCIRALGYSWINGVLEAAGFFAPQATKMEGIWLAGDYSTEWPVVVLPSVNDGLVKQVTTCYDMAWLFVMLHDRKLVKNDAGPATGMSGNDEMLSLLRLAVHDAGARTLLKRLFEPAAPPFDILHSKIGVGELKGGDCRGGRVNRCTYSEAAILQHRPSGRKFVVVFQGLVSLKADPALWSDGLRRIVELIKLTMDKYVP
ncbi:MAG TPA: hypothetical protein VJT09_13835 [Pyrinomonadaceae bacterium]|nr:hypothetical protein [Pyrinomonadaceae bacterium]